MKFGSIDTNGPNDVCAQNNILNIMYIGGGRTHSYCIEVGHFWLALHNIAFVSLGCTNKCTNFESREKWARVSRFRDCICWIAWLKLIGIHVDKLLKVN